MKLDKEFIKEKFQNLQETYQLEWTERNDYFLMLENQKLSIEFCSDPRKDGIMITLNNKQRQEFYYIGDIEEKLGFEAYKDDYLSPKEKEVKKNIGGYNTIVYQFEILLSRYCKEALFGNFSKLGKGRSDF